MMISSWFKVNENVLISRYFMITGTTIQYFCRPGGFSTVASNLQLRFVPNAK